MIPSHLDGRLARVFLTLLAVPPAGLAAQSDSVPPLLPPGRLVDVGGWRLHLNCTGEPRASQPTVILEAGIGDFSVEWSLVQPGVARFARVCSYDRAGDGWSELGPNPRTFRQIVYELHTVLQNAGETPPFVLVGHSYGGGLIRQYAATYPAEVFGLVLVEAGADNPWRLLPDGKLVHASELATGRPVSTVKVSNPLRISDIPPAALAQMKQGMAQAMRTANDPPRNKLPPEAQRMRSWALGQVGHVAAAFNPFEIEELALLRMERLKADHLLGDLPLIVLTRGISEENGPDGKVFETEHRREHEALAAMSRRGKLIVATRSGHHVQLDQPELVIQSIREVLDAGRLDEGRVQRALDDLQAALRDRWSYRGANGADFDAAIAVLRSNARNGMPLDVFGLEVHKILALGIDGHSGVDGYRLPGVRYLPFLIEPDQERAVAFTSDRTGFLANDYPYLTAIDGRPVDEWCSSAMAIIPKGSPQYRRHRCLAGIRNLDFLRGLLGVPLVDSVTLTLTSRDRNLTRTMVLPVTRVLPAYGSWPRQGSRVLPGNIGYLRLETMVTEPSVAEIKQWMPQFRGTAGLIIDVRGNTGGDRDALRLIYSYLAAPGDPPRVFTAAAYRLHASRPGNYLATNHRMYRAQAPEWSAERRQAVLQFARRFRAQWEPPRGQFSELHYMALDRLDEPEVYYYDKPTIVLLDGRSFSATDIFLAGLKGMRNVTLVGTPSGGGSAFTQDIGLGDTPIRIRIGSMVSYQADGRLFDGNGITPDALVRPAPDYYIGGNDIVLAEALRRLRSAP